METRQAQLPSVSLPRNAPALPFLPDELTVEILSWLPVKSLLKFRCVCKLWKSVISDPNFVKLHLHRSSAAARKAKFFLHRSKHSLTLESLHRVVPCSANSLVRIPSYTIDHDNWYISYSVGSCNGLVCLLGYFKGKTSVEYCFYLWNAATKLTSKKLACLPFTAIEFYRFGFGYDYLSDTYKVLAFSINCEAKEESQKMLVKICSLRDNCWRNIHSFPAVPLSPWHLPRQNNDGVYFNGTLNWLACCNIISDAIEWDDTITMAHLVIVSFDLGMETYTKLLLPRLDETPCVEPTIGVLMDCLYFSHECKRTNFVIWQMKEFGVGESWTQLVRVSYQDLQIDCLGLPFPLLGMSDDGDVLIMATTTRQAIMFHWRDSRVEKIRLPKYIDYWDGMIDYVESLASPCCN